MALILAKNYKGTPAVSKELAKVLSINISIGVVDRLIEQAHKFKTTVTTLTKLVMGVSKKSTTCMNKVDRLSNEILALKKRVVKFEGNK